MFLKVTTLANNLTTININRIKRYTYNNKENFTTIEFDNDSLNIKESEEWLDKMLTDSYIFIKRDYGSEKTSGINGKEVCCGTCNCESKE